MKIRAATRGSALARWQADYVASLLSEASGLETEPVIVSTQGDRDKSTPLHELGGKGVFVKEVQVAVLDGRADIAVHSAKDLPAVTPDDLVIAAVPVRADARDALVGSTLADLATGARVGTGSVRRQVQLAEQRPDIELVEIRGNIDTRLGLISAHGGELDAIVMAAAALDRLERSEAVVERLDPTTMLPQVGQGALAVECRADNDELVAALRAIDDPDSHRVLTAERAFLHELGGDCDLPAGAYATLDGDELSIAALLADDSGRIVRDRAAGTEGVELGRRLAIDLRARLH